ncbi:MAG: hypothetical protein ABGY71_11815 [bacterium]|jgi:hypothetical protein
MKQEKTTAPAEAPASPAPSKAQQGKVETPGKAQPVDLIDYAKLDLGVEKVDERISPSETNVFDK